MYEYTFRVWGCDEWSECVSVWVWDNGKIGVQNVLIQVDRSSSISSRRGKKVFGNRCNQRQCDVFVTSSTRWWFRYASVAVVDATFVAVVFISIKILDQIIKKINKFSNPRFVHIPFYTWNKLSKSDKNSVAYSLGRDHSHTEARDQNLMFFVFCGKSVCACVWKQGI